MFLVNILKENEDAFVCDLAQYYNIYDWHSYSPFFVATLASGLPYESRTMQILSGTKYKIDTMLLAVIADKLSLLWWAETVDAQKNQNRPKSFVDILIGNDKKDGAKDIVTFNTPEEFDAYRAKLVERKKNG